MTAAALGTRMDIGDLTFRSFCLSLGSPQMLSANIHWAPQVNFLVYDTYDDYFCLERFGDAIVPLREKAGLEIIDARSATRHGIDQLRRLDSPEMYGDAAITKLRALRASGKTPDPQALYDADLVGFVGETYAEDIALYNARFPGQSLFPTQPA